MIEMGLKEEIMADFKTAMKEKDKMRLSTLKLLKSSLRNKEIEEGGDLKEEEIRALLAKEAKQREESIEQYEKGNRQDLADKEKKELEIIQSYLPDPLSEAELDELVDKVIEDTGAADMSDMGQVMGKIMPEVRGRADGSKVQQLVQRKLS